MSAIDIIAIVVAYLAGSVSFAILISRLAGTQDPREVGSQNPGATNMLTAGGKKLAALVLLCDVIKSFVPIFVASVFGLSDTTLASMGLASILGHLYPIFHRFKGGKGVASCLGVLLALSPFAALLWVIIWLIVAVLSRLSSLGGITACAFAPLVLFLLKEPTAAVAAFAVIAVLVVARHSGNIKRIYNGEESRLF